MQHTMTWEAYWQLRVIVGGVACLTALAIGAVRLGYAYWEDTHIDDTPMKVTKILGL